MFLFNGKKKKTIPQKLWVCAGPLYSPVGKKTLLASRKDVLNVFNKEKILLSSMNNKKQ